MDNDEIEVDDVTLNLNKKKKIKTGSKGKRAERNIVHQLNNRFIAILAANPDWGQFSRSVGSGNRWGQVTNLPKHAKDTFSGDITIPENFKFVIESKNGYNDIDLINCFEGVCRELDNFLGQVTSDSERSGRIPLLIWKKDRKKQMAFVRKETLNEKTYPEVYLTYKNWIGLDFGYLLSFDDNFWFNLPSVK